MDVCEIILFEHSLIIGVLDRMEREIDEARWTPVWMNEAMDFLRDFVAAYHEAKEEKGIFTRLLQRSPSLMTVSIATLRQDHSQCHDMLAQLEMTLKLVVHGEMQARQVMADHLTHFIGWKRQHVQREDNHLCSLVAHFFRPGDHDDVKAVFDAILQERLGPELEQNYKQWAHRAIHT